MQRSESKPLFRKIALIGAGLIGSSIAHGIKNQNLAKKVSITAQSQDTLNTIIKLGLANEATLDQKKAVSDCELVIICAPLGSYSKIIQNIGSILEPGTIVSDVGSVKQSVIELCNILVAQIRLKFHRQRSPIFDMIIRKIFI